MIKNSGRCSLNISGSVTRMKTECVNVLHVHSWVIGNALTVVTVSPGSIGQRDTMRKITMLSVKDATDLKEGKEKFIKLKWIKGTGLGRGI